MSKEYYKEQSKLNWYTKPPISIEQLKLGCLMRMAESLEKFEKPYKSLIDAYNYMRISRNSYRAKNEYLTKSNAAYRGHIKRLKK